MSTLTDPATPIAATERAPLPDVLRGFALLGILLMNIEAFVGPLMGAITGLDPALTGIDAVVDAAIYILVQGKFYTLFSLLFGAGFAMILMRAQARGVAGGWLYLRRLLVLLGIGLVHALYIWSGDILLTYALVGFVLVLLFRRTPQSRLPKWAAAFFLLPMLYIGLIGLLGSAMQAQPDAAEEWNRMLALQAEEVADMEAAQRAAYGPGGSFTEANAQRRADLEWLMSAAMPILGPVVLAMFLLGAWFMRSGALTRPEQHLPLFRRLLGIGLLLGLPLALLSFALEPTMDHARMDVVVAGAFILMQFASVLLCLGYLSAIALGMQSATWAPRLALLAPAGRMALTNYLTQSIVCVAIFYGYGLGWFEQLPRAWQVPFCLALFALQVAFSHWWLARFRFGPAEWLWRSLTYLRLQPMR